MDVALKIGICVPTIEGGAICHQEIGREAVRRGIEYPEILTHTPRYAGIRPAVEHGDFELALPVLQASLRILASAGAGLAIIPSNTMHAMFDQLAASSAIPLLHIVRVAAAYCVSRRYRRVAIMGTAGTINLRLFDPELAAAGIETVYPSVVEKNELNRIISSELVKGLFIASSREYLIGLTNRLGTRADAVILGCTELPLVVTEDNCETPLIDTTRLLARAALDASLAERPERQQSLSASA
jgi:aspartate racemase